MNDCVYSWIMACDCTGRCDRYKSVNNEEGGKIARQHDNEINNAVEPVQAKYKKLFEEGKI